MIMEQKDIANTAADKWPKINVHEKITKKLC